MDIRAVMLLLIGVLVIVGFGRHLRRIGLSNFLTYPDGAEPRVSTVSQQSTVQDYCQPSASVMSNIGVALPRSLPGFPVPAPNYARADEPTSEPVSQPATQPVNLDALRDIIKAEVWAEVRAEIKRGQEESVYDFVVNGWQTKDGKAITRERLYRTLGIQDRLGRQMIEAVEQQLAQAAAQKQAEDEQKRKEAEDAALAAATAAHFADPLVVVPDAEPVPTDL